MSFLVLIPLISCIWFAALYPLFVWINRGGPISASFYQFNMGLTSVVASIAWMIAWSTGVYPALYLGLWLGLLLVVTGIIWGRDQVNPYLLSFPSLIGIIFALHVQALVWNLSVGAQLVSMLGSLALAGMIYTGVLGHWYLNVAGLPMKYLMRGTLFYSVLLVARALFDLYVLATQNVLYRGDFLSLLEFTKTFDGSIIWLAMFFGWFFSLLLSVMVIHIIRLKNTQAATGVLYVVLASLLMGDFFYKYLLMSYHIIL